MNCDDNRRLHARGHTGAGAEEQRAVLSEPARGNFGSPEQPIPPQQATRSAQTAPVREYPKQTFNVESSDSMPVIHDDEHRLFARRHIGVDAEDQRAMLAELGCDSLDALVREVVPASILSGKDLPLRAGISETEVLARIRALADQNTLMRSFIGEGYYNTCMPAVIARNVLENPAWYTAYTPYQPEISQGRLEALMLYQTMVCDLSGFAIANASLLDEASACAEALSLCLRANGGAGRKFFVDDKCLPHCIDVVRTRALASGAEITVGARREAVEDDYCAILIRYPDVDGAVYDFSELARQAHARGALVVVATDLLSLALIAPPAQLGADVAVGSSQRLGVPLGCGGPHAAFIATDKARARLLPGRLVGASVDNRKRLAWRLALQTREQHIRRERATSNICTAQTLPAVLASFYALWHGPDGLRAIAQRINRQTRQLAGALVKEGYALEHRHFFDTVVVHSGEQSGAIMQRARERGINLRMVDDGRVGFSLDETVGPEDMRALLGIFCPGRTMQEAGGFEAGSSIPDALVRRDEFLTHPNFHRYHSETEMMRYLRHLANLDIGLDTAMIPLGSCTMKLNASVEMTPISWPAFADIHPHAPAEQRAGYAQLVGELEQQLCVLTGYDAVSIQPNAGSQGELAGILAVRAWLVARGEARRDVCLIPRSAHGTNPASAMMCGLRIVAVECDRDGNIDLDDLQARLEEHGDKLALMMITYPSTHGVFETHIERVCELVHCHGGQVYMDGANFNAMVGLCYPAHIGCDVSHLNLHKTFCIPHGGGGPGVGPVCVREHLRDYLPGHRQGAADAAVGPVAGALWGSAGILPISWSYIQLMGGDGLRRASECAILNANYIAWRLKDHYPLLYTNGNGRVAHECIIDLRPYKSSAGVEVDDVAKRLIDYGFHPPTMSFPVPGTLMIEPTESESKTEIDRFVEAMLAIRKEIAAIEDGRADRNDNVLRNAPHCLEDLLDDDWPHPYTREQAAYPVPGLRRRKHWPPVGRIDQAHGDRNLVCACPPLESYE